MKNELEEHEGLEEEESGFMGYEELMEARKITFADIKEHLTGPVISTVIHIVLLAFLGTIIVFKAPEKAKEITVAMKKIEIPEIEPPPPPPEPPEQVEVETPTDTPIERPNMDVDVEVPVEDIKLSTLTEIDLPSILNMKVSNSALSLPVNPGGGSRRGGGGGNAFGNGTSIAGDLVGIMYDLKVTPEGTPRDGVPAIGYSTGYWKDIQDFMDAGMEVPTIKPWKQMPKKMYLSHLYIPNLNASEGPEQFGLADQMKACAFFVHYSGFINPTTEFRFAGIGDDLLLILVDGKIVLDASWSRSSHFGFTRSEPELYDTYTKKKMIFGTWVKPGKHKFDIIYGERPGGKIAAFLLIQEKNKVYEKGGDGRPLLPIFTTAILNDEEKARVASERWTIKTDGPVMGSASKLDIEKEKEIKGLEIE